MVVTCEFLGVFGWYFFLAFLYAPDYSVGLGSTIHARKALWQKCDELGNETPYCIKEETNYRLRLSMMADYMLTPFVVNQLINIGVLVLVPKILMRAMRRYDGGTKKGCCSFLCVSILMPIFGGDCDNYVTAVASVEEDPKHEAAVPTPTKAAKAKAKVKATAKAGRKTSGDGGAEVVRQQPGGSSPSSPSVGMRKLFSDKKHQLGQRMTNTRLGGKLSKRAHSLSSRFHSAHHGSPDPSTRGGPLKVDAARARKLVGQTTMGTFEPFYEYLELYLNFCWVVFFSVVFPLGPVFALVNNCLELRSDMYKVMGK